MNELISVIIPVFNHAHTIECCLKSLEKQTYRLLEIIIVNDGSTDDFDLVIKKIKAHTTVPLKIISQNNAGAGAARNAGFKEAKGEYVIFWDADTVAKPKMLERLKRQLDVNQNASYAYCQFKFGWKTMHSQNFNVNDLKRYNYIDTTSLIRRSALPEKPFDEPLKRFQDWDLWLTLAEQNKTGTFVPEVLFTKIVGGRKGISSWLPSFVYQLWWKSSAVKKYDEAKKIVLIKHGLL